MAIVIDGNNTPTAGGIGYGDGTELAFTTVGSSGQVLQSNGASAPSWVTPSPSAMTLISTQTASNSASLAWTGLSGYNNYMLIFDGLAPNAGGYFLYVQVGTPSYITSYTANEIAVAGNGAVSNSYQSAGSSIVPIGWTNTVRSTSSVSGAIRIYNMTNSVLTNAEGTALFIDQTNNLFNSSIVSGQVGSSTAAKTAIRILYSTSNIVSGTASLYGITS
jgi:hypothetical protein